MDIFKPVMDVIKAGERFLVASHAHPDGDGIGSTIALAKGIESLGKKAVMYNTDNVPYNLKFLPYVEKVVNKLAAGETFDATFMVDCSQRKRIGGDVEKFSREALGKIVLIDHHKTEAPESDVLCIDEDAAATGEVIFRMFRQEGIKVTKEIAQLLFCTFVVDTGSFRYSNTTAGVLRDAAALIEAGASPWSVTKALDESNPPESIKLLKLVLGTFEMSGKLAWIILTHQMLAEAGASIDMAEEFIGFPRSVAGVEIAILFRELKKDKWKISFRSKDTIDVRKIAATFDGGGHAHAAGCTIEGSLASVKARVFKELKQPLNNL